MLLSQDKSERHHQMGGGGLTVNRGRLKTGGAGGNNGGRRETGVAAVVHYIHLPYIPTRQNFDAQRDQALFTPSSTLGGIFRDGNASFIEAFTDPGTATDRFGIGKRV